MKNILSKKIFIGLLLALILSPVIFSVANAQAPDNCGILDPVACIPEMLTSIVQAVNHFLGWLLAIIASAVTWMINYGTTMMSFPAVVAGFKVTLSFVNLLFVMALIVIAFEIILDYHPGEAKKTLARLILAALLVNFSLLIAGFLLDFSNVFTNYFLSSITAEGIGAALEPQNFTNLSAFGNTSWSYFSSATLSLTMTAILLIAVSAVFVMALIRNIFVAGLLLTMPLTWGLWIFPGLHEYHSKWWNNFIKYGVIYLPTITFFLWLALATSSQLQNIKIEGSNPVLLDILNGFIQQFLIIGIIVFGLKAAQEMGGAGASLGHSMYQKAAGAYGKGLGFVGRGALKYSGLRAAGKGTVRGVSNLLTNTPLRFAPLSTTIAGKLQQAGDYSKIVKEAKEKYDKLSAAQRANLAAHPPLTASERAGLLASLASHHEVDKIDHDQIPKFIEAARAMNPGTATKDIDTVKDLIKHDPYVAALAVDRTSNMSDEEFLSKQSEAIIKAIHKAEPNDIRQWSPATIATMSIGHFSELTNDQIKSFAKANPDARAAAINQLERVQSEYVRTGGATGTSSEAIKRITRYYRRNPALQIESDLDSGGGGGGGGGTPAAGGGH